VRPCRIVRQARAGHVRPYGLAHNAGDRLWRFLRALCRGMASSIRFIECAKHRLQRPFLHEHLGGRHPCPPMRQFRHESCCHPTFPLRSNTWTTPIFKSSVWPLTSRSIGALSKRQRVMYQPRYSHPQRPETPPAPSRNCPKEKQTSSERLSARG
jgi:hypothetical protein